MILVFGKKTIQPIAYVFKSILTLGFVFHNFIKLILLVFIVTFLNTSLNCSKCVTSPKKNLFGERILTFLTFFDVHFRVVRFKISFIIHYVFATAPIILLHEEKFSIPFCRW